MSRVTPGSATGSVTLSTSDVSIGAVEIKDQSSSVRANVLDLTNNDGLAVAILDGSGNQITSFGGGTQYTEGDTDASITGTASMMEVATNTLRVMSGFDAGADNVSNSTATLATSSFLYGYESGSWDRLNSSSGNLIVNVGNLAVGQFGNTDDTAANLTSGLVFAEMLVFDGTTWDRLRGNSTDGALVNLGSNNDVTVTGTVDLGATDNAVLDAIAASVSAIDTDTTTIIGHLDGVEGILTTIDADTGNISTKIDTIAGAVSGTEMQVDVLTMPTVTVNSHAVTNAGTFVVQENGAALTALQLIDDTVATLGTTTYTETTTKGLTIGAVRRDADTTLVDTTNEIGPLQMNAAGQLKVEVFSGEALPVTMTSTTVTGTVAVTQSGTWDEVGINDSGNSITVDNGGTFATQVDGAALTALQLIDDVVYTDDTSTHATGTSKGVGIMGVAVPTDTSISANDIGMVGMSTDRRLYGDVTLQIADTDVSTTNAVPTKGVPSDIDINGSNANHAQKYYTNAGAVTDGIIWSPAAGKRWHVLTLYINVSAAATVTLEDDLAGGDSAVWKGELAANSGVILKYDKEHPFSSTEDAADLIITTTAGNVYVQAVGYEV